MNEVGGRIESVEHIVVRLMGAINCADLGGSSNYSSESLEGRSGEGFHVNSSWT